MRKLIACLFSFSRLLPGHSQDHIIDSLKNLLAHATRDSARASLFESMSVHYFYTLSRRDSGILLAKQDLRFANSAGLDSLRMEALWLLGNEYESRLNLDSAKRSYFEALAVSEQIKPTQSQARILENLGRLYYNISPDSTSYWLLRALAVARRNGFNRSELNILTNAINVQWKTYMKDSVAPFFSRALQLCRELKDTSYEAYLLMVYARASQDAGNYPLALQTFLQSIDLYKQLKDSSRLSYVLYQTGRLYYEEQDYQEAITYLHEAENFGRSTPRTLVFNATRTAMTYLRLHERDSAQAYAEKADAISKTFYKKNIFGGVLNDLGLIYFELGNDSLALAYLRQSYPDLIQSGDEVNICETTMGLANVFNRLGEMDSTVHYARQTLQIAKKRGILKYISDASALLTSYFKRRNMIDSAFYYQEIGIAAYDSLYNREKVNQFQNLSFTAQQRKLDIASAQKTAQMQYRNNLKMYAFAAFLFVISVLAFHFWRNNRQRRRAFNLLQKQKHEIDLQKRKAEETLEELRSTQKQLIHSEKMASLGELTAGIAHEIQNPLNFVNNFSEVNNELIEELKAELATGNREQATEIADNIKENEGKIIFHGKRADAIVKSMLQHSRASSGKKELTDINIMVDEYLRLAYHGMRAKDKSFNVTMKTDYQPTLPKLEIIQQDVGRVVLNLITNAFYSVTEKKKTPQSPKGDEGDYEPMVTVTTKTIKPPVGGVKVAISVRDNGNGIPPSVMEKIFQPFFTTKPTGQGTGLGLSLSYDIIKAHDGELTVNTEEGKYAEFTILLPS